MSAIVARDEEGRWLRGSSGNPSGRRAEAGELKLVRVLAREHTATAIARLVEIAEDTTVNPMARVRACEVLLSRGWGQPSPEADLDGADRLEDDSPTVFVFRLGDKPLEIEGKVVVEADCLERAEQGL